MYSVEYTNRFRKDLKLCQKRGKDIELLRDVIKTLVAKGKLPAKYRPHILTGGSATSNRIGCWYGNNMTTNYA